MSKLTVNDFSPLDPPIVGHTAFTVIDTSPAPHRASWRAVKDELASVAAELARLRAEKEVDRAIIAAQDARLAKADADLKLEREARAVAERIARERAATIAKLEPLAAVGQLTALLPVGWWLGQLEHGWQVRMKSGSVHAWGATPLDALQAARLEIVQARIVRAAGIGEGVGRG